MSRFVITQLKPFATLLLLGSNIGTSVNASLIALAGTATVTVAAAGETSPSPLPFTINPSLALSSLQPNSAAAGGPSFLLTVNGSGFTNATTITWNGASQTTNFVNSGQLTTTISASLIASAGTASVTVAELGKASPSPLTLTIHSMPACTFSLTSSEITLSQIGTATTGGVLPEVPVSILAGPNAGSGPCLSFTASSSVAWLNATGGSSGFSFTALANPHPTERSASITVGNVNGGNADFTVTEAGDPEPLLSREVRALYQSVLDRDPDSGGFAFWTGIGSAGLGQMLDSFLTSPEAFNSDFAVMATYQAATGTTPTYAQFTNSVASVRAGTTIGALFQSLISASYTTQDLYQNLLNRAPLSSEIIGANAAGLAAWFQTLLGYPSTTPPATAPNNEFMSTGTFHTGADHTNGLYIAMLYYVILNRDPDQGGYNFWLGVANSGGPGILFQGGAGYPLRIQILGPGTPGQGFAGSPEFQGLYQ